MAAQEKAASPGRGEAAQITTHDGYRIESIPAMQPRRPPAYGRALVQEAQEAAPAKGNA